MTVQKYFSFTLLKCIRCGAENIDGDAYLFKQPAGMTTKNYGGVVKFTTYYQTQQIPSRSRCKGRSIAHLFTIYWLFPNIESRKMMKVN